MSSDKLPDSRDAARDLRQRVKGFLHQRGDGPRRTLEISIEALSAMARPAHDARHTHVRNRHLLSSARGYR